MHINAKIVVPPLISLSSFLLFFLPQLFTEQPLLNRPCRNLFIFNPLYPHVDISQSKERDSSRD